jgi:hypothetical protein
VIGSHYQPRYFERRTLTSYSALLPPVSGDALRVQSAMSAPPQRRRALSPELFVGAVSVLAGIVVVYLLSKGILV